ncbi:hypothetical protein EKE94_13930 [Mesobaculum littorinae]|uniref:Peptidase metallopeptidase domain-containing protein n=1 Tax=Mesobaculum littorinae TaxID=2486419 RepID=A0A438AG86_9RHOB|nr:M10 family metallopeptidase [Mesobaculum littorinae]RVV97625.1 hypothetical protein EKE94_13930 [Mesobaculum littorinae]
MCTLCIQTATFDPSRHLDGNGVTDPALANLSEGADAAADIGTAYSMQPGDTFSGVLDAAGDRDWIGVTLEAGESYGIEILADGSGEGTLDDSFLRLYDARGNLLVDDDDGGQGLDSAITFTPVSSGTYYVAVGSYNDGGNGSYSVSIETSERGTPGSLDDLADFLTEGYWDDGVGRRSFDTSDSNQITVNLSALSSDAQQLARWALEAWELVADIDFAETGGRAQITFDDNQQGAFAGSSFNTNGVIQSSTVNIGSEWLTAYGTTIDTYSFATYIHEIGHALGLGHQGAYNGNAVYGRDETFANDSWQVSVMSYFSQTDNTTVNASYAAVITAMMADIVAIQDLYGASTVTSGNTVWGVGSTLPQGYLTEYFGSLSGRPTNSYDDGPVTFTIFDNGGVDTVNLSFSDRDDRIDMRGATFSDVAGLDGNVGIARGTVIEHLVAGSGNDDITGNDAGNRIDTGAGNDVATGGAGEDTLLGGTGQDMLRGGSAFDLLRGGVGNDTLIGENGRDTVHGEGGDDVLQDNGQRGPLGRDLFFAGFGDDTVFGGGASDTIFGGNGDDVLYGGLDNDEVYGGNNYDFILGMNGDDTLVGENGRDTVRGGNGNDLLQDNGQGGFHGADLFFGDNGNDTIFGGGGMDTVIGANGSDSLYGGLDRDEVFGGSQYDFLHGGAGDDTLQGDNGRDTVRGGNGNDLILDNVQGGVNGADIFFGEAGNDTFRIGGGNDTITGGTGSDTFVFAAGHGNDVVTDFDARDGNEVIDLSAIGAIGNIGDLRGAASQIGDDVRIDTGGGNSILLENVLFSDLDADDFTFV